jgi:DNA-binding response OmpR family regulator
VSPARILLVEDDERIGASLQRALNSSGYEVLWVTTGREAIAAAAAGDDQPHLVLLDLGLPDVDGLEVCRRLQRHWPELDVIMLTARDDELDVVVGLDAGAVDYVTKPFRLSELLARIRAQLRRAQPIDRAVLAVAGLTVDSGARRVWVDSGEITLRAKEFDLLARLVVDAGCAVSRDTLMRDVWDAHWVGSTKTLDFHVAALRRKLDPAIGASRITTVRGVGFRFESP